MIDATLVADRVRAFAAQLRPGDAEAAARGAAAGVRALVGGASVQAACAIGRQAVRRTGRPAGRLDLAS